MSNLQYIGARYVPKFYLNPDYPAPDTRNNDWKSGVDYEALMIVTYNNDSYTSKKVVPDTVGNPADNPEYWACTTKYTAALIALQTTVADHENRIDNLEFIGKSFITPQAFGAYGDGVHDDTNAIQSALDEAKRTRNILLFPYGIYNISTTLSFIMDTDERLYIMGCNSIIKATASMTNMFYVSANFESWIRDLTFDCDGKADNGLFLQAFVFSKVDTVAVMNYKDTAFTLNAGNDIYINNCVAWNPTTDTATGLHIVSATDCVVTGFRSRNAKYGVISEAINEIFEHCHVYPASDSDAINGVGFSLGSTSFLTDCCSDSYKTAIKCIADTGTIHLNSCHLWHPSGITPDDEYCMVYVPSTYTNVRINVVNSKCVGQSGSRLTNLSMINRILKFTACEFGSNFSDINAFIGILTGSAFPTAFSDTSQVECKIAGGEIYFRLSGTCKYDFTAISFTFGGTLPSGFILGAGSLTAYIDTTGYPSASIYMGSSNGSGTITGVTGRPVIITGKLVTAGLDHLCISDYR